MQPITITNQTEVNKRKQTINLTTYKVTYKVKYDFLASPCLQHLTQSFPIKNFHS